MSHKFCIFIDHLPALPFTVTPCTIFSSYSFVLRTFDFIETRWRLVNPNLLNCRKRHVETTKKLLLGRKNCNECINTTGDASDVATVYILNSQKHWHKEVRMARRSLQAQNRGCKKASGPFLAGKLGTGRMIDEAGAECADYLCRDPRGSAININPGAALIQGILWR